MSSQAVPMLLYHAVSEASDPRFAEWTVAPAEFAEQMRFLADNGYRTMTVREFVERAFDDRGSIDPSTVVITFDDGFADFHAHAWPRLRALSLTATVFVTTGYVGRTSLWLKGQGEGSRPMLTWSQIEELAGAGIEFGAHSHSHRQLDAIPGLDAWAEVVKSRNALEARVGEVASFAYPHGYYTRELQRQVARAGFSSACAVKDAFTSDVDDRFALARAIVRAGTRPEHFRRLLRGEGLRVAPTRRGLRRRVWRVARRSGAGSLLERLQANRGAARVRGDP
jgi:peptidoglycan/xylan/chitin deacetylase (PgdA/CDA1 family)